MNRINQLPKIMNRIDQLLEAASNGDIDTIKDLIAYGIDVNVGYNQTALMNACINGHTEVIKLLLHHGADVNQKCADSKRNAIGCLLNGVHEAFVKGYDDPAYFRAWKNVFCPNALKIMQWLVDADVDVNNEAHRPLFDAARINDSRFTEFLVQHGADVYAKTLAGGNLLMSACGNGSLRVVKYLRQYISLFEKDSQGSNIWHYAVCCHKTNVAKYLLTTDVADAVNEVNDKGETPIHCAADSHYPSVIAFLLEKKVIKNINAQDHEGNTPLHLAAGTCYLNSIKTLLAFDANCHVKNHSGQTPLDMAEKRSFWANNEMREMTISLIKQKMLDDLVTDAGEEKITVL